VDLDRGVTGGEDREPVVRERVARSWRVPLLPASSFDRRAPVPAQRVLPDVEAADAAGQQDSDPAVRRAVGDVVGDDVCP